MRTSLRTCSARIGPTLTRTNDAGYPESYRRVCRQRVGLRYFWDGTNTPWAYCGRAGHLADVLEQSRAAEEFEKARHDVEREARPVCNDFRELRAIRPELAR